MRTSASTYSSALGSAAGLMCLSVLVIAAALIVSCGGGTGTRISGGKSLGYKTVSWYGPGFNGKRTASGEIYDMNAMTCAHKQMPFGSRLRIQTPDHGRSVVVTVNDRGPFVRGRDIDLSRGAAIKLDIINQGTARVKAYYIDRDMRYAAYLKDGKVEDGAPLSKAPRASAYTIQVASFREKDNADYLMKGLSLAHDRVYMMEKWINGSRYYRVRVGKFRTESKALKYAKSLAYEGYRDVHVTAFE